MIIMIIIKRSCNYFTNAYHSCTYHAMYVNMFVFLCALSCMWSCVDIGKTCSHWLSNKMLEFEFEFVLSPRGTRDTEPWPAWVPQATIYRDPTHTSCTRLSKDHQWQRPNWCCIPRFQQGLWYSAPQTLADEAGKLWHRRQNEHLDCHINARLPTKSDDQWSWIWLVPCLIGCRIEYSDRPNIVSSWHQRHRHKHQLMDETFRWW